MEQYFVIELDHRPDGVINQTITRKETFASALSFYDERKSKMRMTNLFTQVAVMVTDSKLSVIEQAVIPTLYQPEAVE